MTNPCARTNASPPFAWGATAPKPPGSGAAGRAQAPRTSATAATYSKFPMASSFVASAHTVSTSASNCARVARFGFGHAALNDWSAALMAVMAPRIQAKAAVSWAASG